MCDFSLGKKLLDGFVTDKMIMFLLRPTCDNKNTVKKKKTHKFKYGVKA